jgi:hypothetical protein
VRKVATFRTVIFCQMVVSQDPSSPCILNDRIINIRRHISIGCVSIAELSSLILWTSAYDGRIEMRLSGGPAYLSALG